MTLVAWLPCRRHILPRRLKYCLRALLYGVGCPCRQHYSAIMRLKQFFPFHLIDAMGSLADTKEQITKVGCKQLSCACALVR